MHACLYIIVLHIIVLHCHKELKLLASNLKTQPFLKSSFKKTQIWQTVIHQMGGPLNS